MDSRSIWKEHQKNWPVFRKTVYQEAWAKIELSGQQIEKLLKKYDGLKKEGINVFHVDFLLRQLKQVADDTKVTRRYVDGPWELIRNGKIVNGPGHSKFQKRIDIKCEVKRKKRIDAFEELFKQCLEHGVDHRPLSKILSQIGIKEGQKIQREYRDARHVAERHELLRPKKDSKEKTTLYRQLVADIVDAFCAARPNSKKECAKKDTAELLHIIGIQKSADFKAIEPDYLRAKRAQLKRKFQPKIKR